VAFTKARLIFAKFPPTKSFRSVRGCPTASTNPTARYSLKNIGTEREPIFLLLEITYLPGSITRACYQLDRQGVKMGQVDLKQWIKGGDQPVAAPECQCNRWQLHRPRFPMAGQPQTLSRRHSRTPTRLRWSR